MKAIKVQLFGAFKRYVPEGSIEISIALPCTVEQFKIKVHEHLTRSVPNYSDCNLVFESAVATSAEVLTESALLNQEATLALLPPVCGG